MLYKKEFYKKEKEIRSIKSEIRSIKRLDKGETIKKLAVVGKVTIGDRHRNKNKLELFSSNKCSNVSLVRKSLKKI